MQIVFMFMLSLIFCDSGVYLLKLYCTCRRQPERWYYGQVYSEIYTLTTRMLNGVEVDYFFLIEETNDKSCCCILLLISY